MNGRFLAVGVFGAVLGIGFLTSSLLSQTATEGRPPAEQAGSLFAGEDTPADGAPVRALPENVMVPERHDSVEQQARSLLAQLRQRVSNVDEASSRDIQLKAALDRYFASSQIDQAVRLLEAVVTATPNTPEAHRAEAAIQMLRSGEGTEAIMPRAGVRGPALRTTPARPSNEPTPDVDDFPPVQPKAPIIDDPFAKPTSNLPRPMSLAQPPASALPKRGK